MPSPAGSSKPNRTYVRLPESTWAEIRALWEVGDVTLVELSEQFGISRRAVQLHLAKHSVVKGSKAAELATSVKEEIFAEALPDKEIVLQRAREIRETAYANAVVVERLIMGQLDRAQEDPTHIGRAAAALRMLSLAAGSLERLHNLKRRSQGLDRDSVPVEEYTEFVVYSMGDEEIAKIRRGQELEDLDGDDETQTTLLPPAETLSESGEPPAREPRRAPINESGDWANDDEEARRKSTVPSSVLQDGSRLARSAR